MILCHAANVQEYKTNCYVLFSNKLCSLQYSARGSKQNQTVWNIPTGMWKAEPRTTVTYYFGCARISTTVNNNTNHSHTAQKAACIYIVTCTTAIKCPQVAKALKI
jgi:hypothetical protein